jgi:hypothetical protein
LASEEPTNHVGARHFLFWVPLAAAVRGQENETDVYLADGH